MHTFGEIGREIKDSNDQFRLIYFSRPKVISLSLHLNLRVKQSIRAHLFKISICLATSSSGVTKERTKSLSLGERFLSIQLRHKDNVDEVPTVLKPHEIVRIECDAIFIEQAEVA